MPALNILSVSLSLPHTHTHTQIEIHRSTGRIIDRYTNHKWLHLEQIIKPKMLASRQARERLTSLATPVWLSSRPSFAPRHRRHQQEGPFFSHKLFSFLVPYDTPDTYAAIHAGRVQIFVKSSEISCRQVSVPGNVFVSRSRRTAYELLSWWRRQMWKA